MILAFSGLIGGLCGLASSWLITRETRRREIIQRRLAPTG